MTDLEKELLICHVYRKICEASRERWGQWSRILHLLGWYGAPRLDREQRAKMEQRFRVLFNEAHELDRMADSLRGYIYETDV